MEFLFGKGNKFFSFATKLAELMWLNILTIACSLPVITVGAAFTARHRVLVDIYRDEEIRSQGYSFPLLRKISGRRPRSGFCIWCFMPFCWWTIGR